MGGTFNAFRYHADAPSPYSRYPPKRTGKDENNEDIGVMGSVELLNYAMVADQPLAAFSWSPDKLGLCAYVAYDQSVRVGIVTKLNQLC